MANFDNFENYEKLLSKAVNNIHPLMIFCNLSNDFYQIISYSDTVLNNSLEYSGSFDTFISNTKQFIQNKDYANLFLAKFSRYRLLQRVKDNDNAQELQFPYLFTNQAEQWIFLQLIFVSTEENNVQAIILGKNIDEEKRREVESQRNKDFMAILASEYSNVYHVDMDSKEFFAFNLSVRIDSKIGEAVHSKIPYTQALQIYADSCTFEEDRKEFLQKTSEEYIKNQLSTKDRFFHRYRNEANQYCEMKCVKVGDWSKEHKVIFGFAVKDSEIRREIQDQRELKEAKERAEAASAAKTEFLAKMSHDIRTPINGVIGMAELALKNIMHPYKSQQCIEKIITSAFHLNSLVNDILDMSHIESNKLEIAHKPLNILSLADGCLSIIEGQLINRNLKIITEFEDFNHPFLLGDELHLRQAIVNILGNAVKFTPDGGKVIFRIQQLSTGYKTVTYRIEVQDTGIGMKAEFLNHIWDTFSQEDGGARSEYKGSGLGTAIAKSLIELMGGTISVKSKLNEGSTFTIDIPFAIDDRTETVRKNDIKESGKDGETLYGARILLVEDNETNRESAQGLLEAEGAKVDTAENGKIAVKMFEDSKLNTYDAILMDIMMPVMNGIEATKAIRSLGRSDAAITPIIALTANAFEEDVRNSLEAGMNEHLTKPLEIAPVIKTLIKCMRAKSLKQAEQIKEILVDKNDKDKLTGVGHLSSFNKSKHSINEMLKNNPESEIAIFICDINSLRKINDKLGNDTGDNAIITLCHIICDIFKHSPVFRIDGGEFAVILQGNDFANYDSLSRILNQKLSQLSSGPMPFSVATGYSQFKPQEHKNINQVIKTAEKQMLSNKKLR
ncbi:MAG: response regulator [Treponema sp.]|nr:response regulator [Treponema sp.]